ncbi:MAG TPA: HDOD domain-containing protein [Opitutaceae bacterium]|nr:HDOD domain-containing protein [Opitutaceae bacterium]
MVSPLGQQTIKHVTNKLEAGESAGLSEIVELIQKLSTNAFETSVQELANLIGKDVVVTAKVIAAAHTIGYNPNGLEVGTITQAIHVIGFNKIRQLAVSLLLIENANRTLNPSEKREIAALALCSGLMAESVMVQRGKTTSEHAFICASLRNYGRMLMTTFMIDDYRRARIMSTSGITEDEAFNRVFGLTPLELGHHLLASAHLPDPILKSLRALPAHIVKTAVENPELEMLALADLSVKMCELALRTDISAADFNVRCAALATRNGQMFDLDAGGLMSVLHETGRQLNEFASTFGLNALAEQVASRIEARVTGREVPGSTAPMPAAAESQLPAMQVSSTQENGQHPSPSQNIEASPSTISATSLPDNKETANAAAPTVESTPSLPVSFEQAIQSGIEEVASLLEANPVDMKKVFEVVLKSALKGFGSKDGAIFVRDARLRCFSPTHVKGTALAKMKGASPRDDDRDVFGLCLQRLEDVLIYDAADPKIVSHLPAWIKATGLASFVLLPIQENRQAFGVLMAGWSEKKTAGFTVAQIRQVRSMLKLAGTARRLAGLR